MRQEPCSIYYRKNHDASDRVSDLMRLQIQRGMDDEEATVKQKHGFVGDLAEAFNP